MLAVTDSPLSNPNDDLDLRILRVGAQPTEEAGTMRIMLQTSRGDIEGIMHVVEGGTGAVVCVGGAMGGLDGPADKLYAPPKTMRRSPVMLCASKLRSCRMPLPSLRRTTSVEARVP